MAAGHGASRTHRRLLVKVEAKMLKVILLAATLVAAVGCRTPGSARCPVG